MSYVVFICENTNQLYYKVKRKLISFSISKDYTSLHQREKTSNLLFDLKKIFISSLTEKEKKLSLQF